MSLIVALFLTSLFSLNVLARDGFTTDTGLPDAVLFTLANDYRGFELIHSKFEREGQRFLAVVEKKGRLFEVALDRAGVVYGSRRVNESVAQQSWNQHMVLLDKDLKRQLVENGFDRRTYRQNQLNATDPYFRYNNRFGYGYYPYRFGGYHGRLGYGPRFRYRYAYGPRFGFRYGYKY